MNTEAASTDRSRRRALSERWADAVGDVDGVNEPRMRLALAILLAASGIVFFRQYALAATGLSLAAGMVVLALLYFGFHRIGLRPLGRLWPGPSRAAATALLVGCLCPPGLPLALIAVMGGASVLVEGLARRFTAPVALGGILVVWPLGWLWRAHAGLPLLSPFQLRPLDEPIILWTRFQIAVDPIRLYAGNVAGPVGATSFGVAVLCFVLLAYVRRTSWAYLLALYVPVAVMLVATQQPITVYVVSGQAMVLGGVVAAESSRLPRRWQWQAVAGLLAGAVSAILLWRGTGQVAYGAGIVAAAATITAFQLLGLTGAVEGPSTATRAAAATTSPRPMLHPLRVAILVLLTPIGLYQLWRDGSLPLAPRRVLTFLGAVLYASALGGSLTWLWLLRVPS